MSEFSESGDIQTPNFALSPADIPRVESSAMPSTRITLQHLEPYTSLYPIPQRDAVMTPRTPPPHSTLILDFMYGVATYRRWGGGPNVNQVMEKRFTKDYKGVLAPAPQRSNSSDDSPEPDDPSDPDYIPSTLPKTRNHSSKMSEGMLRAMDEILMLSMLLKGTTPQQIAQERLSREQAAELRAKENSRVKVQEWMQSSKSTC